MDRTLRKSPHRISHSHFIIIAVDEDEDDIDDDERVVVYLQA